MPPTKRPRPLTLAGLALAALAAAFAPADPEATREAVCRWAATPPRIDGKLDDPVWESATVIDRFPTFWKKTDPGKTTRARLLWDNDALYIASTMKDADLISFGTKRNDHLWNGDVFEMFFKPSARRPEYYEFQVNPKSVVFEVPMPKRGADLGSFSDIPSVGMKAVAMVEGTLDKAGDTDTGWSVEIRIPWTAFRMTGGRPSPGEEWLFALCRYDYGANREPVLMSSAPLTEGSFHRYEDYGKLRFEGPVKK